MSLTIPPRPDSLISRKDLIRRRGWTDQQITGLLGDPDWTDESTEPPSRRWAMSRVLAAEAAHPDIAPRMKERSDRQAEQALADQQVILDYVAAHPGVTAQEVIGQGRGHLSRSRAEQIVKELLYREPKQLRSEHPAGTRAFGRGYAKLYIARCWQSALANRDPQRGSACRGRLPPDPARCLSVEETALETPSVCLHPGPGRGLDSLSTGCFLGRPPVTSTPGRDAWPWPLPIGVRLAGRRRAAPCSRRPPRRPSGRPAPAPTRSVAPRWPRSSPSRSRSRKPPGTGCRASRPSCPWPS
jgi:hypothetical protein